MKKYLQSICIGLTVAVHVSAGGFATLKMGADGRTSGMGLCGTALVNGASSSFWNPALTGETRGRNVTLSVHRWMDDIQSEYAGYTAGNGSSGLGLTMLFTEIGDLRYAIIPTEQPAGFFSAHEMMIGLSTGFLLIPDFRMGISVKGYYEKIFHADTWGLGGDIGILWQTPVYHIRLGAVVQNIGKTGRLQNESIPLPLTLRVGLALPVHGPGSQWLFCTDVIKEDGFPLHVHTGAELIWNRLLALRVGYQTGYDVRDVTTGIGIIRNTIRLDYGYMPMATLGDSHRLSLSLDF